MPTDIPRCGIGRVDLVALLLAILACSQPGSNQTVEDFELPSPDLSGVEEAVRKQLEATHLETVAILDRRDATPSEVAAALGDLGRLYHSYDLLGAAEQCYQRAASEAPEDPRWPYYLGFLEQSRGRWGEAALHFERFLELEPGDPPARLRLAAVTLEAGDAARAEQLYELVRQSSSATTAGSQAIADAAASAAFEGLARIATGAQDHAGAVLLLEQALSRQPTASALHHQLASAYRALGEGEQAALHQSQAGAIRVSYPDPLLAGLDRDALGVGQSLVRGGVALAEGRPETAIAEYRRAVEQDPSDFSARLNLGLVLADQADPEAELHLREAIALDPRSAVAHHALGRRLADKSEVAEARELYQRALELDPGYEAAHYHLGELEAGEGRHPEALAAFTSALEINQQARGPRAMRALSFLALDRPSEAVEDLRIALESGGDDEAVIRLRLGEALQLAGETDGALLEYEKAASGGLEPRLRASAELSAGNLLLARGERDAARLYLEGAVDSDPQLGPAHFNLAGLLQLGGEPDLAAVHYRRAVELEPEHLPSRFFLGQTLLETGLTDEASKTFDEVLAIDPWHEGALLGKAAVQGLEKRYSRARSGLEAALAERPTSTPIAHALARLLATSPDPAVRDGEQAVELSLRVMSVDRRFQHAETVAMSMAAAGRFEEAINWQREILRQAKDAPPERLAALKADLARYENGQACCG